MQLIIKQSSAEGGNNFHFGFYTGMKKEKAWAQKGMAFYEA